MAKTAYLGVVGIGKGTGALGHVFLLIKNPDQPYLVGDAYQYNISSKDGKPFNHAEAINNTDNLEFSLKKQKFLELHAIYTSLENRIISLYELQLNNDEVNALIHLLNIDLKDLSFTNKHPYGIYNNCVTRPIELLNQIVDQKRQIEYLGTQVLFMRPSVGFVPGLQGALLNRLPIIIATTMQQHPISKGLVHTYENKSAKMERFFKAIRSDLESMQSLCGWKPSTIQSTEHYFSLYILAPESYPIEPFLNLSKSCPTSIANVKNILLKLYQLLDSKDESAKKHLYGFMNDLLGVVQ